MKKILAVLSLIILSSQSLASELTVDLGAIGLQTDSSARSCRDKSKNSYTINTTFKVYKNGYIYYVMCTDVGRNYNGSRVAQWRVSSVERIESQCKQK